MQIIFISHKLEAMFRLTLYLLDEKHVQIVQQTILFTV